MNWIVALVSLGSSLIVAVATAVFTVRLALRRFYSEKWWERKANAYSTIVESMHHVREHADTLLVFETKAQIPIRPEDEQQLTSKLQEAIADLRKHRDIGSFLISDGAVGILNTLFNELDKSAEIGRDRSYFEYLDYRVGTLDHALAQMREVARNDLSLNQHRLGDSLSPLWSNTRIRATAILLAIVLTMVGGLLVAPAALRSIYEIKDLMRARDHRLRHRAFAECVDRVNLTYGDPVPDGRYAAYSRDWAACQKLNPGPIEP